MNQLIITSSMDEDLTFSEYLTSMAGILMRDPQIDLSIAIKYIRDNFTPEKIFSEAALKKWAELSGLFTIAEDR